MKFLLASKAAVEDFPGDPVVTPTTKAGDTGSISGPGRFHVPLGQLSPQLLSLQALEPMLCNKRRYCNAKPVHLEFLCNEDTAQPENKINMLNKSNC